MARTTFNRLRSVKDSLPHGSMDAIAAEIIILNRVWKAELLISATPEYWR